jgi:hypothetical protein
MRSFLSSKKFNRDVQAVAEQSAEDADKEVGIKNQDVPTDSDTDEISADAQPGVQDIEAITKVWSKTHLVLAYIM